METLKNKEDVISKDVALAELADFVEIHLLEEIDDEKLLSDYPQLVTAVIKGMLVLNTEDSSPEFSMLNPIKDDEGEVVLSSITFRTRIKASTQARFLKGKSITTDQGVYMNKIYTYFAQLKSPRLLDKLCKFDEKVIQQLSALFI